MLQMGKWRHKEATGGAELAFEPRPPGSSPRSSPAWPVSVLTEASFEDAGLSGGPPFTPGGLTLAVRGAEERESGGHTMISKGILDPSQEEQQGWVPRAKETGPVAVGTSPPPPNQCVPLALFPDLFCTHPPPGHNPNLTSEGDETNTLTGETH